MAHAEMKTAAAFCLFAGFFIHGDTVIKPYRADRGLDTGNTPVGGTGNKKKLFLHLTDKPVVGVTLISQGVSYRVRYVDQETGRIYEMSAEGDENPTLLSNKTIPRIQEAFWGNGNDTIVMRYLETNRSSGKDIIRTYVGSLINTTDGGTIEGKFLPDNISIFSVSPNGAYGFYFIPNETGITGFTLNMKSLESSPSLQNAFREWLPQTLNSGLFLVTKASANIQGYAYLTSFDGKNSEKGRGQQGHLRPEHAEAVRHSRRPVAPRPCLGWRAGGLCRWQAQGCGGQGLSPDRGRPGDDYLERRSNVGKVVLSCIKDFN